MSYTILRDSCIDCGGCEFVCPTGAIHPPAPGAPPPAVFWIETHRCNDCGVCASVCPEDCILPDPDTIVCMGRGCPLSAERGGAFAGRECSQLESRCGRCDHVLWRRSPEAEWTCIRCAPEPAVRRHLCPKVSALERAKTGPVAPRRGSAELYANRDRVAQSRDGREAER